MRQGQKHSPGTIAQMKASHKKSWEGRGLSPKQLTHLKEMQEARVGTRHSAATRAQISTSKTGQTYGPPSEEHRANLAGVLTGVSKSPGHRANIKALWDDPEYRAAHTGPNNHNWTGGLDERHRIMGTAEYAKWRKAVFARDDYTCRVCGKRGGHLEAHHIIAWGQCKALVYDVPNGLTACKTPCHMKVLHLPSWRLAG